VSRKDKIMKIYDIKLVKNLLDLNDKDNEEINYRAKTLMEIQTLMDLAEQNELIIIIQSKIL
jgi:hypothetical protein